MSKTFVEPFQNIQTLQKSTLLKLREEHRRQKRIEICVYKDKPAESNRQQEIADFENTKTFRPNLIVKN
jgi:hypothetical protein